MAMNKKELAEMERLREELRITRSMRFTDPIKPDVDTPKECGKEFAVDGWSFNEHCSRVDESATTGYLHTKSGFASTTRESSWCQGAIRLYSTKLLALKALRCALEKKYAKSLADIDRQIEEENQPC